MCGKSYSHEGSKLCQDRTEDIKALVLQLGFAKVGVARVEALQEEAEYLSDWLLAGRHGQMQWMQDTQDVRVDPRHAGMLPKAKSVLMMAVSYAQAGPPVGLPPGKVARYAQGRDYHNVLGKRANKVAKALREQGFAARAAVDSKPVFERAWAERAGLGFVGKNCCLIIPGLGSHVFLACVVTEAELVADAPMARKCGTCDLCLQACPTDAFVGERQLDARRCISYLTIEHKGAISAELRRGMGEQIFGCDICQDVCPYNQGKALGGQNVQNAKEVQGVRDAQTSGAGPTPVLRDAFANDVGFASIEAERLLQLNEDEFQQWAQGSPLRRARREGMARNAAIVLGNSGERRYLKVLQHTEAQHDSEVVRDAAAWALGELQRD